MNYSSRYHYQRGAYDALRHETTERLLEMVTKAWTYLEELHDERFRLISLIANLAVATGARAGIYPLPTFLIEEPTWRHLVIIDLPAGQLSFPVDDLHLPYFKTLGPYRGVFYGFPDQKAQQALLLAPELPHMQQGRTDHLPTFLFTPIPDNSSS
jgi:hypothetical protein